MGSECIEPRAHSDLHSVLMGPVLLVRCDAFETFGVAPAAIAEAGARAYIWDALGGETAPALEEVGGIVVFGSTSNVEDAPSQPFIGRVGAIVREAVDRSVPVLGVCFGAQVLAWTLGAAIRRASAREVGFEPIRPTREASDDRLLSHYGDGDQVFQWHMDTFDLPEGATLLASGDRVAHQAFRVGAITWGVQFHLEIDAGELEQWLDAFAEEGDLLAEWGKTADQVRHEASRYLNEHERRGAEVFRRFAAVARDPAPV